VTWPGGTGWSEDGSLVDVADAVEALRKGELVVLPTDTVYGVAARPDLSEATARLFEAKGRPRDLNLPVLVADRTDAARVGLLDDRGRRLADEFWPGGLTVVVRRTEASRGWNLGEEGETVGVRVPDQAVTREILREAGPLAVTSANRSGEPTPETCEGVRAALGKAVAVYVCDDASPPGPPSTVIDLTGPEPRVLREGALDPDSILAVLG
jgi:L-threonylcarbamoyladenylate synthase